MTSRPSLFRKRHVLDALSSYHAGSFTSDLDGRLSPFVYYGGLVLPDAYDIDITDPVVARLIVFLAA